MSARPRYYRKAYHERIIEHERVSKTREPGDAGKLIIESIRQPRVSEPHEVVLIG